MGWSLAHDNKKHYILSLYFMSTSLSYRLGLLKDSCFDYKDQTTLE